jgi:hypothetical protein
MNKLKKYRVGVYFEEGQVLTVEAESKEAAEKIAMDAVDGLWRDRIPEEVQSGRRTS